MVPRALVLVLICILSHDILFWPSKYVVESKPAPITDVTLVEGKVIKGTRNGLYLVKNGNHPCYHRVNFLILLFLIVFSFFVDKIGKKSLFPDFHTFTSMGFTPEGVLTVDNTLLEMLPEGDAITAIPMFRPEDYMYHTQCEYPENIVSLSFIE